MLFTFTTAGPILSLTKVCEILIYVFSRILTFYHFVNVSHGNHCDHCTWMTSLVLQRQLKQSVAEACQGNCEVLVPTSRHPWISMITDTSMSVYLKVVNNNKL